MLEQLPDRYNPQDVEGRIYDFWMKRGYFKSQDVSTKRPYCIILPPPNVTGQLHMGHALDHTIQDVLVRWKRMSGFNALWLPGTDHAGIATQAVVEKNLKKDGQHRKQMGREVFIQKVWDWKNQYGGIICDQMKRLGDSVDWDRQVFTLDEGVSKAVRKVFVSLYKKGWIVKGNKLVNWSTALETAISDLEVIHQDVNGNLWHIDYLLEDGSGSLTVATTRPETLLGDTAICVHPDDSRYKRLIGKKVVLPLLKRKIPIIADEYVDKEFGSGVVKITPGHDFNDYQIGIKHKLEMINILEKNGILNDHAGPYKGLKVLDARKKVLEDLEAQNLLRKVEPHRHSVGHCERSGVVVEPFLSEQWFVKAEHLAKAAKQVVETGTVKFEPESWAKVYLHWMEIIQDWCISRQLWWGHRIPAWHCEACGHATVSEVDPTECEKCKSKKIKQDEDVLDTWFSSALWPFSTMGWPKENELQKTFYPTDVLVTGHDIIFFWVARMIMMGIECKGDVPFRTVYIHGLVRDAQGKKMSKSSGTALDPVELIEKYGADALRFTIMAQIASGKDLKFSEKRLEGYRNFMNKIWNATRFAMMSMKDFEIPQTGVRTLPNPQDMSLYDKWIIFKLANVEKVVDQALENYRFSDAANAIYDYVWHEFCDWYLELIKPTMYAESSKGKYASQIVLAQTLNRIMRLLHPFIPFITEEIYQKLPLRGEALTVDVYPNLRSDKEWLDLGSEAAAFEVDVLREVITALRNIRGENVIKAGAMIQARVVTADEKIIKILNNNKATIMTMSRLENCEISNVEGSLAKCAIAPIVIGTAEVKAIIPLEGLVDFAEETKRITKAIEKTEKDIDILNKKFSNESFVKNAPEEVIEADKILLDQHQKKIISLRESLKRLQ